MQLGAGQVKQLLSMVGGGQGGGQSGIKNVMLGRALEQVKRKFDANPTEECLQECTREVNGILGRLSSVLGDDLPFLSRLGN